MVKAYGNIRDDAVDCFAITLKPEMEFMRTLTPEQQKQYLRDSYECLNKFMHDTATAKGVSIPLQSGVMHFDELNPHMHTFWTFTATSEKGLPSFGFKKVFTQSTYKNMQAKTREMMIQKGWSVKEVIAVEELTPEERRERQVKSGRSSQKIKADYKKENEELQKKNDELKKQIESGNEAKEELVGELTKQIDKYDELKIKNENKEKELSDKNKKIEEKNEELKNKTEQIKNTNENIQRLQQEHELQLEKNRKTKDIATEEYKKELKFKTTTLSNEISPKYTSEKSLGLGKGSIEVVDKETLLKSDELLKTKDKLNKTLEIQHEEDQSTIKELEQKVENLQSKESVQAYEELQNKNNQQQVQIYQLKKDNEDLRYNTVPLEEAEELRKNNKILKNMLKNVSAMFWNFASHTPFKSLIEKIFKKEFPPEFQNEIIKASHYQQNELLKDTLRDEDYSEDEKSTLLRDDEQQQQQLQDTTTEEAE